MASLDRTSQEALPREPISPETLPRQTLPRDFFARPAVEVAPDLLDCVFTHETAAGLVAVRLTEVEAYAGQTDPASHAYRGQTARNAVMFGPPGHAYVYFTYGMHFCVNLVCMPPGTPFAVLLRAGEVIAGEELAWSRRYGAPADVARDAVGSSSRGAVRATRDLARGPARLCQALGIDRSLDGADVCDPGSPLQILPRPQPTSGGPPASASAAPTSAQYASSAAPTPAGNSAAPTQYATSAALTPTITSPVGARIMTGPRVGIREAADVPWRFWLDGEPTVSAYRAHVPRKRGTSR
ncbi:MAG TPA: DNA-3-methyladenine glycosylase [Trebonia sp.]